MKAETKICSKCRQEKDCNEFYLRKASKGKLTSRSSYCITCTSNENKRLNNTEESKRRLRNNSLKHNYGITLEEYEQLVTVQNGKCALCGVIPIPTKKYKHPLVVDHCHISNGVRELLCYCCNNGLGMFKENIELLQKAIKYIEKHKNSA